MQEHVPKVRPGVRACCAARHHMLAPRPHALRRGSWPRWQTPNAPRPHARAQVRDFFSKPCWAHHPKPYGDFIEAKKKEREALEA